MLILLPDLQKLQLFGFLEEFQGAESKNRENNSCRGQKARVHKGQPSWNTAGASESCCDSAAYLIYNL